MKLLTTLPVLAALAVSALGAYCDGMTQDVDWCWNGVVYGRCTNDKLAKSGECDYESQECSDLSGGGISCVSTATSTDSSDSSTASGTATADASSGTSSSSEATSTSS